MDNWLTSKKDWALLATAFFSASVYVELNNERLRTPRFDEELLSRTLGTRLVCLDEMTGTTNDSNTVSHKVVCLELVLISKELSVS